MPISVVIHVRASLGEPPHRAHLRVLTDAVGPEGAVRLFLRFGSASTMAKSNPVPTCRKAQHSIFNSIFISIFNKPHLALWRRCPPHHVGPYSTLAKTCDSLTKRLRSQNSPALGRLLRSAQGLVSGAFIGNHGAGTLRRVLNSNR